MAKGSSIPKTFFEGQQPSLLFFHKTSNLWYMGSCGKLCDRLSFIVGLSCKSAGDAWLNQRYDIQDGKGQIEPCHWDTAISKCIGANLLLKPIFNLFLKFFTTMYQIINLMKSCCRLGCEIRSSVDIHTNLNYYCLQAFKSWIFFNIGIFLPILCSLKSNYFEIALQ